MKNEIEVIDGVKGKWRTVTKPSQVTVGQRVRYTDKDDGHKSGYTYPARVVQIDLDYNSEYGLWGRRKCWKDIQAFFPLATPSKRKVAKVTIRAGEGNLSGLNWFNVTIQNQSLASKPYITRSHAIRGARRFCKAIGYECEIVK